MNKVLSDKRLGAKLRVTENRCVLFDSFTYIYIPSSATKALSTLCQGRLYPHIYVCMYVCMYVCIYIYIYIDEMLCQKRLLV